MVGLALLGRVVGSQARARYEARVAELRAAGEPLTLEDFMKRYPGVAPEHDLKAFTDSLPSSGEEASFRELRELDPAEAASPELREKLEADVRASEDLIRALRDVDFEDFHVGHDWQQWFEGRLDSVFGRLTCAWAVCLDAVYQAEHGDGQAAAVALGKGLQLAYMDTGSGLDEAVGGCAVETITLSAFPRVLSRAPLGEPELRRLAGMLDRRFDYLTTGFRYERARLLWWCDHLPLMTPAWRAQLTGSELIPISLLTPGYQRRLEFLDHWQQNLKAVEPQVGHGLSRLCELTRSTPPMPATTNNSVFTRAIERLDFAGRIQEDMERRFLQVAADYTLNLADHAAISTAIALKRWTSSHSGQLPDSLVALVPDYLAQVPEDPYDGQPIRYRRTPTGFLVYSIGQDQVDNGGTGNSRGEKPGTDLVVSGTVRR